MVLKAGVNGVTSRFPKPFLGSVDGHLADIPILRVPYSNCEHSRRGVVEKPNSRTSSADRGQSQDGGNCCETASPRHRPVKFDSRRSTFNSHFRRREGSPARKVVRFFSDSGRPRKFLSPSSWSRISAISATVPRFRVESC